MEPVYKSAEEVNAEYTKELAKEHTTRESKTNKIEVQPNNLDVDLDGKYYGIRITSKPGSRNVVVEHKTKDGDWVQLSCVTALHIDIDVHDHLPRVRIETFVA